MSSVPEKNDVLVLVPDSVPVQVEQNEVVDVDMISSVKQDGDVDSMSSSIGVMSNGNDANDEDDEEIQSQVVAEEGALNSLAALEAALPFKRGLSDYYDGKSRTFMNLGEVKSVEELQKEKSPMNKRRRLTMAQTSLYNSSSMPHLTHFEGEDTHNVEVEQDLKSSTSSTSLNSADSHPPSHP